MKRVTLLILALLCTAILLAETNPVNSYFASPTDKTFAEAWKFCSDKLEQDSTQTGVKILMANLAILESNRIAQRVYPEYIKMSVGNKFQYANLLLAQNRFEEAIDVYIELNMNNPTWSCPWRHKGEALYNLHRYRDAETSFSKAIETNPEHYDAYIWMAKAQYKLKKYKPALKNLEKAMTLNPEEEESPDEVITDDAIKALHQELLKKTGKKK